MTKQTNNTSKSSVESLIMPEPSEQAQKSTLSKSVFLLPYYDTIKHVRRLYSIIAAMQGQFIHTAVAIFIAMIFDALDGRLARLTNTSTEFGAQLDSIADMVSFGLAPAVLLYIFSLHQWGKVGWLIAFLYAACTGLCQLSLILHRVINLTFMDYQHQRQPRSLFRLFGSLNINYPFLGALFYFRVNDHTFHA